MFTTAVVGAKQVAMDFATASPKIHAKVKVLTRHHGQLLRTRVMANASGRPGPNAPTGDYRRSIALQVVETGGTVTAYVGTNLPQGPRLEYGFHGADSLGRVYDQDAYPHFGPALDAVGPGYVAALNAAVAGSLT